MYVDSAAIVCTVSTAILVVVAAFVQMFWAIHIQAKLFNPMLYNVQRMTHSLTSTLARDVNDQTPIRASTSREGRTAPPPRRVYRMPEE